MDSIVFRSLGGSNMPRDHKKSIIREFYDSIGHPAPARAVEHGAHGFRQGAESLILGSILGAAHAENGLDISGKAPADLLIGIAGLIGAIGFGSTEFAVDLRNLGATGFSTFGFRQGYAFVAEKKRLSGAVPTGFNLITKGSKMAGESFGDDVGEDPIQALAKEL